MFDVKKHLIKLDGNHLYLPVSARLVWFRQEHPDWGIETRPITIDLEKQFAIFEATVFNAEGKLMARGTKMETSSGFPDYIEAAETGAIGRALAVCGFGTQFAPDLDEVTAGRTVDMPHAVGNGRYGAAGYPARRTGYSSGNAATRPAPSRYADRGVSESGRPAAAHGGDQTASSESQSPASAESSHDKDSPADRECSGCGRAITKGQDLLSMRKFGVALCPDCQKERRAVESEPG